MGKSWYLSLESSLNASGTSSEAQLTRTVMLFRLSSSFELRCVCELLMHGTYCVTSERECACMCVCENWSVSQVNQDRSVGGQTMAHQRANKHASAARRDKHTDRSERK